MAQSTLGLKRCSNSRTSDKSWYCKIKNVDPQTHVLYQLSDSSEDLERDKNQERMKYDT